MKRPIQTLKEQLGLAAPTPVSTARTEEFKADGFVRYRLEYQGLENDGISAFFFTPHGAAATPGVVVFHQHNGELHLGKSEVAGESRRTPRRLASAP